MSCNSDLYGDSVEDSHAGSGLSTSESSKGSHPFHFIELVAWYCSLFIHLSHELGICDWKGKWAKRANEHKIARKQSEQYWARESMNNVSEKRNVPVFCIHRFRMPILPIVQWHHRRRKELDVGLGSAGIRGLWHGERAKVSLRSERGEPTGCGPAISSEAMEG